MGRPAPVTLDLPFPIGGRPWCAFGINRGAPAYPQTTFNAFYYVALNPFNLPVHAHQLASDFAATTAFFNLRLITKFHSGIELFPIYLWDGAVQHTYPHFAGSTGLYPLDMSDTFMGVSFTKRFQGSRFVRNIIGRNFISPLPRDYTAGGDRLTVGALSDLTNLGLSLWHDTFSSEGNVWTPAIFNRANLTARPISRVTLYPRWGVLRRRLRTDQWKGTVILPPPFPTPSG